MDFKTKIKSTVTTGTAPFDIASTTSVTNLNVDLLDGKHASDFALASQVLTNVPAEAKFTDTVYTHPASHLASMITEDSTKRFVSDSEKSTWNSKSDTDTVTTINGKTGAIEKADIVALGIPAQDTVVDISGKADTTYVDGKVKTDVPSGAKFTDTVYTHPTTAGNKHIPTGGASGQVLKYSASGTATWQADSDTITTINGKTGAISKADITALGIPAQDTIYTHPNHSGDVTSVADGAQTIANNVVNNAKLAQVAVNIIKGRKTAGTGNVEDLTVSDVLAMLDVYTQTEADNLLADKAPLSSPTFTGLITTAGQIAFPTTQNPSSDPNTLDDYEEGNFLPTLIGLTTEGTGNVYATQIGQYVKVGSLVTVYGRLALSTKGNATGLTLIGGLPFPLKSINSRVKGHLAQATNITGVTLDNLNGTYLFNKGGVGTFVLDNKDGSGVDFSKITNSTTLDFLATYSTN